MNVLINGSHLFYLDSGLSSGPPLLFIHGFPFSHAMWQPQMEALGARYRTIAYDVKGHGDSDVGDGQYSIESHVDDLIGLMDHLGTRQVTVVGLSMGGYIALRALEREPSRFTAAILCDTRSEADSNEAKLRRFAAVPAVKSSGSRVFADTFTKAVFAESTLTEQPGIVAQIHSIIAHTPPLSIAGTMLALAARTDTTSSLSRLRMPVLILVGEHDTTTPPDAARSMHESIAGSQIEIVPRAAHMSTLENPAFVNTVMLKFLDQHVPRS